MLWVGFFLGFVFLVVLFCGFCWVFVLLGGFVCLFLRFVWGGFMLFLFVCLNWLKTAQVPGPGLSVLLLN